MNLREALLEFIKIIDTYRETPFDDLIKTSELMKDLSICINYLSFQKVRFKKKWNSRYFELRKTENNATSEKMCNYEIPELEQLREVLRSGQNTLDAIRSHVSLLKKES